MHRALIASDLREGRRRRVSARHEIKKADSAPNVSCRRSDRGAELLRQEQLPPMSVSSASFAYTACTHDALKPAQ